MNSNAHLMFPDALGRFRGNPGLHGKIRPSGNSLSHLRQNSMNLSDLESIRQEQKILTTKLAQFTTRPD